MGTWEKRHRHEPLVREDSSRTVSPSKQDLGNRRFYFTHLFLFCIFKPGCCKKQPFCVKGFKQPAVNKSWKDGRGDPNTGVQNRGFQRVAWENRQERGPRCVRTTPGRCRNVTIDTTHVPLMPAALHLPWERPALGLCHPPHCPS